MIYFLLLLLITLTIYFIFQVVNKTKRIENEINSVLESRLRYTESEYQSTQQQLTQLKFREWLSDNEFDIRRTAIQKMNPHMLSNISSELDILKNNFTFNPKDIKFTGRFIDLIIFDGAADEEFVNIYFIDIRRQGVTTKLNYKKMVEYAITNGNFSFQEINL